MGLQRRGTRTEHGAKACVKNGEHPAARGSSCVLERGCFMSTSSLVKVCGDDLVMRTSHQGERCFSLTSSKTDRARMGVVHPGAPRPWLYLISERRARALRRCTHPQPLITTRRRCTHPQRHPQLACEILINLRFSDFITPQAKQRNNASLLSSLRHSLSDISCVLHH